MRIIWGNLTRLCRLGSTSRKHTFAATEHKDLVSTPKARSNDKAFLKVSCVLLGNFERPVPNIIKVDAL